MRVMHTRFRMNLHYRLNYVCSAIKIQYIITIIINRYLKKNTVIFNHVMNINVKKVQPNSVTKSFVKIDRTEISRRLE